MFKTLILAFAVTLICGCASIGDAQTYINWRKQGSTPQGNCSGLVGANADLCYQATSPGPNGLWICDNAGGSCTLASQWQLVTPMYLSGGVINTYNNLPIQIGTSGLGVLTAGTSASVVIGSTTQMVVDASGLSLPATLGHSNAGTNFVCVNTAGKEVRSTTACSGS